MASIRKRTWASKGTEKSAWIVDYFDQSNVKRRKTFATKKQATDWATTALHEVKQGIHTPASTSVTVARAGELWLDECDAEGLEFSTVRQRRQHLRHHINPHIGGIRLSDITTPMIYNFDGQLRAVGTSLAMRRKVLTSIKTMLSFAQKRAMVAQNVATSVKLKRDDREDSGLLREGADYPSRAQMKALLDATDQLRWRALLVTAMFTGMRASELRGLPWTDVHLDGGIIHVRQRADAWNKIGKPKSKAGSRDIPLAPIVINTLREWKAVCPKRDSGRADDAGQAIKVLELVFPNGIGRVESLQNIYKRYWDPIQETAFKVEGSNAAPPHFGFHSLRHVAASMFIAYLGWTPKRVQEVMGHSSITVTYDRYGHLFQDKAADRDAMKKLEAAVAAA